MTKRELIDYIADRFDCFEDYPFDEVTAVMKLTGTTKTFALIATRHDALYINLKCEPDEAITLREAFEGISPGYHMNKKHWNTILPNSDVPFELLEKMIVDSFNLVAPKTRRMG